jgi:hypothetical protein
VPLPQPFVELPVGRKTLLIEGDTRDWLTFCLELLEDLPATSVLQFVDKLVGLFDKCMNCQLKDIVVTSPRDVYVFVITSQESNMNTKDRNIAAMAHEQPQTHYSAPKLVMLGSAADLTQGSVNNVFSDTSAFSGQGTQVSGGG